MFLALVSFVATQFGISCASCAARRRERNDVAPVETLSFSLIRFMLRTPARRERRLSCR